MRQEEKWGVIPKALYIENLTSFNYAAEREAPTTADATRLLRTVWWGAGGREDGSGGRGRGERERDRQMHTRRSTVPHRKVSRPSSATYVPLGTQQF